VPSVLCKRPGFKWQTHYYAFYSLTTKVVIWVSQHSTVRRLRSSFGTKVLIQKSFTEYIFFSLLCKSHNILRYSKSNWQEKHFPIHNINTRLWKLNAIYTPFSLTTHYKNSATVHWYNKPIQKTQVEYHESCTILFRHSGDIGSWWQSLLMYSLYC
jgi:hypothetical protein